jgi:hypothetical protein
LFPTQQSFRGAGEPRPLGRSDTSGLIFHIGDVMVRSIKTRYYILGSLLLLGLEVRPSMSLAQSGDSLTEVTRTRSAIQIQFYNGVGVNLISGLNATTSYRVGVDVSLRYAESSGPGEGHLLTGSPFYTNTSTSQESESSTHEIAVTAFLLGKIVEYSSTTLYWGIGPSASYRYAKTTSTSNERTEYSSPTDYHVLNSSDDHHTKTLAIGPAALLGVRGMIIGAVGLTAEVEFRAMYESIRDDGVSTSYEMVDTWTYPNIRESHSSGRSTGWSFTLANIRVGVIFGL